MKWLILCLVFLCLLIPASAGASKPPLDKKFARNYKSDYNHSVSAKDAIVRIVCQLDTPKNVIPYEDCLIESKNNGRGMFCAEISVDTLYDNPRSAIEGGTSYSCKRVDEAIDNLLYAAPVA